MSKPAASSVGGRCLGTPPTLHDRILTLDLVGVPHVSRGIARHASVRKAK